jgi:hypothetical protein
MSRNGFLNLNFVSRYAQLLQPQTNFIRNKTKNKEQINFLAFAHRGLNLKVFKNVN